MRELPVSSREMFHGLLITDDVNVNIIDTIRSSHG